MNSAGPFVGSVTVSEGAAKGDTEAAGLSPAIDYINQTTRSISWGSK
jgi:hypothetical protein